MSKKDEDKKKNNFGFKSYGGGPGLQKWDKGLKTICGTSGHTAMGDVWSGELKMPTTDSEAAVTADNIWENHRTIEDVMRQQTRKKSFKKLKTQRQLVGGFNKRLFKILVQETTDGSTAREMVLKEDSDGVCNVRDKFFQLWGTIEDSMRTKYEGMLRSGCFVEETSRATEEENMIDWVAAFAQLVKHIKETYETANEMNAAPMVNYPEDVRALVASLPSGYAPAMQNLKEENAQQSQMMEYQEQIQLAIASTGGEVHGEELKSMIKEVKPKVVDWSRVDPPLEEVKQAIYTEYKMQEKQRQQSGGGGGSRLPTLSMQSGGTVNEPNGCYDCGEPGEYAGHDGCTAPGKLLNSATPASPASTAPI